MNMALLSREKRSEIAPKPLAASKGSTNGLKIGEPHDVFEQEADRVADEIMAGGKRLGWSFSKMNVGPPLQRKCACGGSGCEECDKQKLHRKAIGVTAPVVAPPIVHEVLQSAGQPLDRATRNAMEFGFTNALPNPNGFDFSGVRIHTDSKAANSARAVNAKAYTVGSQIVFGGGYYSPHSISGRQLIAHELAHVAQQGSAAVRLSRAELDLKQVDEELFWGDELTQDHGEVGRGATPSAPDGDPSLPIEAFVFPRNVVDSMPKSGASPAPGPASSATPAGGSGKPPEKTPGKEQPDEEGPTRTVYTGQPKRSQWRFTSKGLLVPARRALVVAGIHGDEQGPRDVVKQLQTELAAGSNPLARDFDTIVIPDANPGGYKKKTRENQTGVDLNRNFPGLQGFPSLPPGVKKQPIQPEVKAIMKVVQTIHPDRILSLHAIQDPGKTKGGVYADPVEGDVSRELACRMALRMRGEKDINVKGNKISASICSARYPDTSEVSITKEQSSLGAWASAPKATGGEGIPVITHEVTSVKKPDSLPATGPGRSVSAIMPGIREFLLDNEQSPSEADSLLQGAVSDAFLTGELADPAKDQTLQAIISVVSTRFDDMKAYYKEAWLPQQSAAAQKKLPKSLNKNNEFRSFKKQTGIAAGALSKEALFKSSNTDDEIKRAILNVMKTISLPGFSRHAWGTEIDLDPPVRKEWEGSGSMVPLIPFLTAEAFKFGFYHPYSDKRLSDQLPHYEDEPWHLSYWSFAMALQQEYLKRITGAVLDDLISRVAKALHGKIDEKRLKTILAGMNLTSFQSNVAPPK